MKGYIFDFDGTIIDSMGMWLSIDRAVVEDRGLPFPDEEDYQKYIELVTPLNPEESAEYAIKFFGLNDTVENVVKEWGDRGKDTYINELPLKPGAKEFLTHLRSTGAKMAIATSAPTALCVPALKERGLYELFDAICTSEEAGHGKSRPDVFLLAAKKLGIPPEDCIVYEDSIIAMKTAKSVGMTVYAVYDDAAANKWEEIKQIADHSIYEYKEEIKNVHI